MKLHLPLCPVQHLLLRLFQIPLSQLALTHKPVLRININFGEKQHQPASDIEPVLVVKIVLGVHEILPLRLRLGGRGRVELGVAILELELLPLLVLATALDVGDYRVKGDAVVVGAGEGVGGAELEAAGGVVVAAVEGFVWGVRN